ncbi:putative methyltransferase [Actinoplanes sp. N902-109]|nr:putative methyltransferase [Actinoplanes sp. N902-109]
MFHQHRGMAESYGADAERYNRARTSFPPALIETITSSAPATAVDVGCGTGVVARLLQETGCQVLGVEPDERSAAYARSRGLDVEVSTFEAWDPAGRRFDAVVSGRTWHWIDPAAGAAKAASALRPGGRLTVFWNASDTPAALAEKFLEINLRMFPGNAMLLKNSTSTFDSVSRSVTKAGDTLREQGAFTEPEFLRFDWQRDYTRDEWLDVLPTLSAYTRLSEAQRDELLTAMGDAIDAYGGGFTMQYATLAVAATRR